MGRTKGAINKTAREKDTEAKFAKKEAMYKRRLAKKDNLIEALRRRASR